MKEAALYERMAKSRVRCNLCSYRCVIPLGKLGVCRTRKNENGRLFTLVYGRAVSRNADPVEKKPLYHFYPGSIAYSVATAGCNFRCPWCQNWEISQMLRDAQPLTSPTASPHQIVADARRCGSRSIAYTYTEPTVFFEYTYDTARLARDAGLANIYVTNGYMTPEMLELLHPYLDAANVDLKAFRRKTYQRYVGARLQPVLDGLKRMKALGVWVEVTSLIIPGVNDGSNELRDMADFIAQELGKQTPWHISRFFPTYRMTDTPPTPTSTLERAREIGLENGLHYVYVGNVRGEQNTFCHNCSRLLIRRVGYWISDNHLRSDSRCPDCGTPVAGVAMASGSRRET